MAPKLPGIDVAKRRRPTRDNLRVASVWQAQNVQTSPKSSMPLPADVWFHLILEAGQAARLLPGGSEAVRRLMLRVTRAAARVRCADGLGESEGLSPTQRTDQLAMDIKAEQHNPPRGTVKHAAHPMNTIHYATMMMFIDTWNGACSDCRSNLNTNPVAAIRDLFERRQKVIVEGVVKIRHCLKLAHPV